MFYSGIFYHFIHILGNFEFVGINTKKKKVEHGDKQGWISR